MTAKTRLTDLWDEVLVVVMGKDETTIFMRKNFPDFVLPILLLYLCIFTLLSTQDRSSLWN